MATILSFLLIEWVFWTLLTLLGIILIINHERDNIGWAHTIFILMSSYALWKFGYLNITYCKEHWVEFLTYIGIYVLTGVIWSIFKWFFYLRSLIKRFERIKDFARLEKIKFINNSSTPGQYETDENNSYLFNRLIYNSVEDTNVLRDCIIPQYNKKANETVIESFSVKSPLAAKHKPEIVSWILHWPVSVLWFIINDPIKKFINYVFDLIKGIYQNISNRLFKNILNDVI